MRARLLYRDLHGTDMSVDVPEQGGALGRAGDCLVRTQDVVVARRNCALKPLDGRWYVEDLNSPNGTFLNEQRVHREKLSHGDVIRCGSLQVRFVEVVTAATPSVVLPPRSDCETRTDISPRLEDITIAQAVLDTASGSVKELVEQRDRAVARLAAAEQHVAELRAALSEAYYGVNDTLADLRLAVVVTRESYSKLEPGMQDKTVAREMRDSIDRTLELARETRNHVRSLRNLIEPRGEKGSDKS